MKIIKIGSEDFTGSVGYYKKDNTLFIRFDKNDSKPERIMWFTKNDAMNIVRLILEANGLTKMVSKTSVEFE